MNDQFDRKILFEIMNWIKVDQLITEWTNKLDVNK